VSLVPAGSVVLEELPLDATHPYVMDGAEALQRFAASVPPDLRARTLRNLCHYLNEQARRLEHAEIAARIAQPWPAGAGELERAIAGACDG
jgi:hypothetical protein